IMVGDTKKGFFSEGEELYLNRIKYYAKVERIVISDLKNTRKLSPEQVKQEEGKAILKRREGYGPVILLDEKGKQKSSENFAEWIQSSMNHGGKYLTFVIGGAYGFSDEVYNIARTRLSLSEMTFNHQMVRMFFFEQVYRAFSIL